MPKNIILFDFDGTIADTYPVFLAFVTREGFRSEHDNVDELRDLSMRQVIKQLDIPEWKIPFIARKFRRYFKKAARDVRLIDGVSEAVRSLHEAGYTLSIVTSNSVSSVEAVLTHEGLLPFFDRIHSEPSVFGKARTLSKMIRKYAVEPGTAWYVGDEVRDVEAAHEAGLQSVAVSWGFNSDAALRMAHPSRLVSTPSELAGIFL